MTATASHPIAALLTAARETAGLSKAEAARRAKMSESWWRKLERGWDTKDGERITLNPSPEVIHRAAAALNTPVSPLLQAAGFPTTDPGPEQLRDDAHELVDLTPEHLLNELVAYMRGLNTAR